MSRAKRYSVIALALLLPAPTIAVVMALYVMPGTLVGQGVWSLSKLWVLVIPLVWLLRVDREWPSLLPWRWSPMKAGGMLMANLTGGGIFITILAAYYMVGHRWIDPDRVSELAIEAGIRTPLILLIGAVYWSTINALLEEYVWRWFVFRRFEAFAPTAVAVVLSALAFTFHHVFVLATYFDWRVTLLGSVGVCSGGLIWSWLYARYRSVWPAYVSHAWADVAIMIIAYLLIFG